MASTFTASKLFEKQGTGDNSGSWGTVLNAVLDDIDKAVGGYLAVNVAGSSDVTLTDDQALERVLKATGALTGNISLIVPAREGVYAVWNGTTGAFTMTVKPASGTGILVPQSCRADLFTDGTTMFAVHNRNMQTYLAKSVAGSSDVTLTDEESMSSVLKLTGALTGNISVIVPARAGQYVVWNATSGAFTVTFKPAGGTGIEVSQGYTLNCFTDGTTMYAPGQVIVGAWTPAITCGTGGVTHTTQLGRYWKYPDGRVFVRGIIGISASTGGSTMTITGLPFASVNVANEHFPFNVAHAPATSQFIIGNLTGFKVSASLAHNSSAVEMKSISDAAGAIGDLASSIKNGSAAMVIEGWYQAAGSP